MQDSWQDRMTLAGYLSHPSSGGLHQLPPPSQPPLPPPPQQQPPNVLPLGWNQASSSSSASDRASHSTSSSLIDPRSSSSNLDDPCRSLHAIAPSASSDLCESTLKEHDYIGLAEVSSSSASSSVLQQVTDADVAADGLNLELGLGPVKDSPKNVNGGSCDAKIASAVVDKHASVPQKGQYSRMGHGHEGSYPCGGATPHAKHPAADVPRSAPENVPANAVLLPPPLKNGMKRIFSETMVEPAVYVTEDGRPGTTMASIGGPAAAMRQLQDRDMKTYTAHQKPVFLSNWTAPKSNGLASWQSALEQQPAGSYVSSSSTKPSGAQAPKVEKAMDASWNTEHTISGKEESLLSEAPPAKGQVVGWPPIRSYRKNTLAARSADDCNRSAVYVKVNMDGVPIGRKVDLNACNSYEGLSQALEEMFANNGYGTRYLKGSEHALTYEDKEGDWMLVGDVPWGMFINTVRRLRIIQGSEVTGLREFKSS